MSPTQVSPKETWNTVVRRKKGPRGGRPGLASETSLNGNASVPISIPPGMLEEAVRDIEATYSKVSDKWRSSPAYRSLASIIRDNISAHVPITQAICLGNGPLYEPDASWDRRRTAHVQTVALLALVELLRETSPSSSNSSSIIKCVFQEPHYSVADRSFLESLGHQVVDDPAAFDMVTDSTLVWGVHMYHQVYNRILRGPAPAMFVGTKWTTWDEVRDADGVIKNSLKRVGEIHATYDMFDFPPDETSFSFCDTCIYWRKSPENTTETCL